MQKTDICSNSCMGAQFNHGGCCTMGDRDYIIGPHDDSEEFIERLKKHFGYEDITYDDVFIEFEEGSKVFHLYEEYQDETNYPALRVNLESESLPCIFYNEAVRRCSVYDIRPNTCRSFQCDYLKSMTEPAADITDTDSLD